MTRSFDAFVDLRLNKRLGKQSWVWCFETPSRPFGRHSNDIFETSWTDHVNLYQSSCKSVYLQEGNATIGTVYPKKYTHGFVVLCFVVVMQSFIMNSHEVFIHIHQGCFAGTGVIVRLPQCQWSKPDGYGKIGQCITTTKHSKAKTVCICLGIYCILLVHPGALKLVENVLYLQWSKSYITNLIRSPLVENYVLGQKYCRYVNICRGTLMWTLYT